MILFLMIAGFLSGMTIPIQTSINSRLGFRVKSPYIASTVSFFVGALVLVVVTLLADPYFGTEMRLLPSIPWWILTGGGFLGVFYLTSNILLLPRLGSALTVVVTLLGQMMMALSIDHFGWFHVPVHELNGPRMIGIAVMFLGVFIIKKY